MKRLVTLSTYRRYTNNCIYLSTPTGIPARSISRRCVSFTDLLCSCGFSFSYLIFTALHGMQTRPSDENSVLLSVCLSVKRVHCDKTGKKSVQIFIPCERSFSLVFWEEWLGEAIPSTWNFGSTSPRWSEIADFEPIFARSASAVTPSEKSSINTNKEVHYALSNEPKMNIVRCP